jgi:hypothetical protein
VKLPLRETTGRILDFDIENMPVTYYAPDYPTAVVTAIAWAWTDDPKNISAWVMEDIRDLDWYSAMLDAFWTAYDEADVVTGHYIRKHDLPIVNGALIDSGFSRGLGPKMVSDTKLDLVKFSDIPKNQEFLEDAMLGSTGKINMTQADWRRANRFQPEGIAKTRKRVKTDVKQNMRLRKELVYKGLLKAPRLWTP